MKPTATLMNVQPSSPLDRPLLVSVCIPVYNGAEYLQAALDSVRRQTWTDLEILAVDDGSSDTSTEILAAAAGNDPRVRTIRNEHNLGLVGNWNRCLELARGEWIKFLFQDDLIDPDCIERMLAANTANNDIVICARRGLVEPTADPRQRQFYTNGIVSLQELGLAGNVTPERMALAMARLSPFYNFLGEPNCWLFRKSCLQEVGHFNPWLVQSCDLEFCLRFALTMPITFVPEPLATFRAHGASTTTRNMERRFEYELLDPLLLTSLILANPRHRRFLAQHSVVLHKWQEQMHLRRQAIRNDPLAWQQFTAWVARNPGASLGLGRLPMSSALRLRISNFYWKIRHACKRRTP